MLERVISPDCPKCGCNGTSIVGSGGRLGRHWARFECGFCGHGFTIGNSGRESGTVNGVSYNATNCRCPKCGDKNPPVRSTQGRIRYHKCANCGQNFKSVEKK